MELPGQFRAQLQVGLQDSLERPDPELLRKCAKGRMEMGRGRNSERRLWSVEGARASSLRLGKRMKEQTQAALH